MGNEIQELERMKEDGRVKEFSKMLGKSGNFFSDVIGNDIFEKESFHSNIIAGMLGCGRCKVDDTEPSLIKIFLKTLRELEWSNNNPIPKEWEYDNIEIDVEREGDTGSGPIDILIHLKVKEQ